MKLVDTNVLVYAVDDEGPHHQRCRAWLEQSMSGHETVALAWLALVGFVRISTSPRAMLTPLSVGDATARVGDWLDAPSARLLHPGPRHSAILFELLRTVGTGGNLVNDAHLAALALEHRAEVITFDTDFARFEDVRWSRPPTIV